MPVRRAGLARCEGGVTGVSGVNRVGADVVLGCAARCGPKSSISSVSPASIKMVFSALSAVLLLLLLLLPALHGAASSTMSAALACPRGSGSTGAMAGKLSARPGAGGGANGAGADSAASGAGLRRGLWRLLNCPSKASVKSTVGVTKPGPGWSVGSTQISPSSARKSKYSSAVGGDTMPMVCKKRRCFAVDLAAVAPVTAQ